MTSLESTEQHLARKQLELALLERLVGGADRQGPLALPALREHKLTLLRELRATLAMFDACFGESRAEAERDVQLGDFRLRWGYQRYDLDVAGPWLYDAALAEDGQSVHHTAYASSGMGAIAALLQALNNVRPGLEVWHLPDAYYETQQYLRKLCSQLRPLAVTHEHASDPLAPGPEQPTALLIDSIGVAEHDTLARHATCPGTELVLIDSTCYPARSPRLTALVRRVLASERPVVLMRSHVKLDMLGVEYARLGSLVFLLARSAPPARLAALRTLIERTRFALGSGGLPHASSFLPLFGSEPFERQNDARVRSLIATNRALAERSSAGLRALGTRLTPYHHGLFSTLRLPGARSLAEARNAGAALVQALERHGVKAEQRGSFGLDVSTVDTFLELADPRHPLVPTVRISLTDLPEPLLERAAKATLEWAALAAVREIATPPVGQLAAAANA